MPQQFLTTKEHILWSQRIQKEEINAQARKHGFSVRSAVTVADVPTKFKPGHLNPTDATDDEYFDPSTLGWDPQNPMAKEFRRAMKSQRAGPRERHQFPESTQQDLGWLQAHGGSLGERSGPSGMNPTRQFGWVEDPAQALDPEDLKRRAEQLQKVIPRMPKDGNIREKFSAPPFATISSKARQIAKEKHGATSCATTAKSSRLNTGASRASGLQRSSSLPASKEDDSLSKFTNLENSMSSALDHSRRFWNRQSDNRWYHPLSNSDVALFADSYTKSWGVNIYKLQK